MHDIVSGDGFPMTGWVKDYSIKDFVESEKVTNRDTKKYKNAQCKAKLFQICQNNQDTGTFEDADGNKFKT